MRSTTAHPSEAEHARAPFATRARAYLVVTALVAAYVALGFVFHLDVNSYLLLGIPLTLGFQVLVARRPRSELWLRDRQFCVDR
jgi:hypothetical protein